ncbi:MAG: transposase [Candidatus Nitrosotenuis sp.]
MIEEKESKRKDSKPKLDAEMMDLINKAADSYIERMKQGEKIGISTVIEEVMSAVMKREREIFLQHVQDEANGFYDRTLQLAIGKLDLKVPRVRFAKEFRPALLPPKWRRVDKDYENLLIAMLTNGYSQSQIDRESVTRTEPSLFTGEAGGDNRPYT